MSTTRRGIACVVLAAVLWSIAGLLLRLIEAPEPTTIFWRSVFAVAVLLAYLVAVERSPRKVLDSFRRLGRPGLAVALCLSLDAVLSIYALNRTTVANAQFIWSTVPVFAALLAWFFLRERVALGTWLAVVACITGIGIMMSGSASRVRLDGDLFALAVAIIFAVSIVIIRRFPHIEMAPVVVIVAVVTAACTAPLAEMAGLPALSFGLLAVFGVFEFGLAFVLFAVGARNLRAAHSSLIGLLEVVLAPLWVWLVVGEEPGSRALVGGAIVLVAIGAHAAGQLRAAFSAG